MRKLYADGLIRISLGQQTWTALVEVKTGTNSFAAEQLENDLDIAREQGFDAVRTISSEGTAVRGQASTVVDRCKLRKVALRHLPRGEVLAEAATQKICGTAPSSWSVREGFEVAVGAERDVR